MFITPLQPVRLSIRPQDVMNSAEKLHSTYTDKSLRGYAWGNGPSILLVHGWEGAGQNFTSLVPPLVDAGFRVIAFDAPARSDSQGSTGSTSTFHIMEYSAVLAALITEFGPMYGVVAHSFGASAIIFMMSTIKHYRIERLALVGAPSDLSDVMGRFAHGLTLTELVETNGLGHHKLLHEIETIERIVQFMTNTQL